MASAKRKKNRSRKKKKSPRKISEVKQADSTRSLQQEKIFRYILTSLLFIYLFYYLFQLYASLDSTFFWADENKHAYISSLVYKNHQIPTVLPDDLYGDYRWSYPPLFHILSAAYMGIAGPASLKFFNLTLLFIFFLSFYFLIQKHYGNNEAIVACILTTLAPVLAVNAIRFTTEMLTMLSIFFSFFFLTIALKKSDKLHAVISGVFTGMLMLSKQVGFVVFGFYGLLFLWFFWKNRENFKIILWVLVIAFATYSPYLLWAIYNKVEILGFVSVFLGLTEKPEWSGTALKVFHRYDSGIKEFAYLFYTGNGLFLTVLLSLPFYYFIKTRFKGEPQNYVFFLFIYLIIVMMAWHITNDRHTIILVPLIAFLISYAANQVVPNKLIIRAITILLLITAGYLAYHMPNYRQRYNAPGEFVELTRFINEKTSSDARILSLSKFDIIAYTQRPVIWPHAKLGKTPIELLQKQSADELFDLFKHYKINYIVIETPRIVDVEEFHGGRYPLYFVRTCERLERLGRLRFMHMTKAKRFILLSVM